MHILVVNDDGPPSNQSSPYVHSLVKNLQEAGHIVSVVLPHTQRSWIGKAHIIGQTVKPTYFRPGTLHQDDGTTHSRPLAAGSEQREEWVLVDGTPASCVQIGLYHFFQDRGPVDLVVSGPNYGRNSTAIFSLSSGTLGGALEAAVCQRRAIALSYAFFSRNHDPEIIAGASKLSVKLIDYLYKNWDDNVDLYSVNVPLVEGVEGNKIMWTNMLQNYWSPGSCFQEVVDEEGNAAEEESRIREAEGNEGVEGLKLDGDAVTRHKHKHFKWAPRFTDVYESVEKAPPGNDGWAVKEGFTSVTPLKANFMHAAAETKGELKLPASTSLVTSAQKPISAPPSDPKHFYALINYEDAYVQPLILSALKSLRCSTSYTLITTLSELPSPSTPFLQISAYESLPFEHALSHPSSTLINSYIIRKALIRKHYLSTTAYNWVAKHPDSILKRSVKAACEFEVDYAEFLDDALVEAWELHESWRRGREGKEEKEEREWWILKPGMSDRGQGIRLFSSEEELQAIFDEWEAERPESDDEDEDEDEEGGGEGEKAVGGDGRGQGVTVEMDKNEPERERDFIVTSHLRHFVAQPYIHPPLLLPGNPRKFHIRTYVLAYGALKVYVYKPMLALFAAMPYVAPWQTSTSSPSSSAALDLSPHLTNTCLQSGSHDGAVESFFSIPASQFPDSAKEDIFRQICEATGELFEAAARGMGVHFQTLPNAFEVFGLDFLVDERGVAWLLECNAFPDFRQTGEELKGVVEGLWREVVEVVVGGFFGGGGGEGGRGERDMVLVRDVDLGRR